jgi:dCMP deaminase
MYEFADQSFQERALGLALWTAVNSPDASTQNGAVVIDNTGRMLSDEYNRFPAGVKETEERWQRPQKYMYVSHAEHNAVVVALRRGVGITVDLEHVALACPWAACDRCAVTIVESGIKTLIRIPYHGSETHSRWDDSILVGDEIMREGGVTILEYAGKFKRPIPNLLRNGAWWNANASVG